MKEIRYKPIGVIRSPFKEAKGTPIQSKAAEDTEGIIEVFPELAEGLEDLEGFSHIILIYHFHLSNRPALKVIPYMDEKTHGVFATRAPNRPNPIGISIARLVKVEKNKIYIKDIDAVEGTPLLDIKPYVPEFDIKNVERIGWLKKNVCKLNTTKDDGRFVNK